MSKNKKMNEIERLLKELKASEDETAVTVEETANHRIRLLGCRETILFSLEEIDFDHSPSDPHVNNRVAICNVLFLENREHIYGRKRRIFRTNKRFKRTRDSRSLYQGYY